MYHTPAQTARKAIFMQTAYRITKMYVAHNHSRNGTGINLDEREEIQFQIDFKLEEVDTIETMALGAHSVMSAIKETLALHYPKRDQLGFVFRTVWIESGTLQIKV